MSSITTTSNPTTTAKITVKSTSNLMIGSITLSSIHLILSLVLLFTLILNPNIIKPNYIEIFLYISMIVNVGIFIFCWRCKYSNDENSKYQKTL